MRLPYVAVVLSCCGPCWWCIAADTAANIEPVTPAVRVQAIATIIDRKLEELVQRASVASSFEELAVAGLQSWATSVGNADSLFPWTTV